MLELLLFIWFVAEAKPYRLCNAKPNQPDNGLTAGWDSVQKNSGDDHDYHNDQP
jgi:hypothetical protein